MLTRAQSTPGLSPSRAARLRVSVVDAARGLELAEPIELRDWEGHFQPEHTAASLWRLACVRVAVLRFDEASTVEVEVLGDEGRLSLHGRWTQWQPSLSVTERPDWQRPGWLQSSLERIDHALAGLGLHRTGPPRQTRHTEWSGILRVPTDGGVVWYKTTPDIFKHEHSVVQFLGSIAPGLAPHLLASGAGWWLAEDFPPERTDPEGDPLCALARIQIASSFSPRLSELACPRIDASRVLHMLDDLAGRELLASAETRSLIRQQVDELDALSPHVNEQALPVALVHGDLHASNARWTERGWFLYDWTDACISYPFVDLARALRSTPPAQRESRMALYAECWRRRFPVSQVDEALRLSGILGPAFQVVNCLRLFDGFARPATEEGRDTVLFWVRLLAEGIRRYRNERQ